MRIVHLDSHQLSRLSSGDRGDRWLKTLASAGAVRREHAPEGSPLAEMSALYSDAWQLTALEEALSAARVTDKITLAPPRRWWLFLPLAYASSFLIALTRTEYGDRLTTFGVLLVSFGLLAVGLGAWIYAATWSQRQRKRVAGAEAAALRSALLVDMEARRDALLAQPFALLSGDRLVVNSPDLQWIEATLSTLPSQGREALRVELQQARERIRAGVDALRRCPPSTWSAEGLSEDLTALRRAVGG